MKSTLVTYQLVGMSATADFGFEDHEAVRIFAQRLGKALEPGAALKVPGEVRHLRGTLSGARLSEGGAQLLGDGRSTKVRPRFGERG